MEKKMTTDEFWFLTALGLLLLCVVTGSASVLQLLLA